MKLKKIASLMLAGIMAVSMLAGCKSADNGNGGASSSQPVQNSGFTSTVLNETKESTRLVLKESSNDKLDKAVAFAAANHVENNAKETLTYVDEGWEYQTLADKVMTGKDVVYADNDGNDNVPTKVNGAKDATVYIMYTVSRTMSDEWIAQTVADQLDTWAEKLSESTSDETYDYTVRVAKADSIKGDDASRKDDAVVVGIAITVDYTKVNY